MSQEKGFVLKLLLRAHIFGELQLRGQMPYLYVTESLCGRKLWF